MSFVEKIPETTANLWQGKSPTLLHLDFELTERCNNNCIHCTINQPADDQSLRGKEISFESIAEILADAAALGCLTVRFTGGEPLLRHDFEKIYRCARKLGLRVIVYTNGTLITPQLADLFSKTPPLSPIEITLYGLNPASESAVTRNANSFEACQKGRRFLLEYGVAVMLKWIPLAQNNGELRKFTSFAAEEWGGKAGTDIVTSLDLRTRRDSHKKNQRIRRLRLSPQERIALLTQDPDLFLTHMKTFYKSNMSALENNTLFACGAGCSGCVDAYGTLQMCSSLRHPDTVYNLSAGSLKDAFSRFFPEVRKATAQNLHFISTCGHCFLRGICEQCPAKSWMEHGTLDTPVDYICQNTHAEAKFLGLLRDDEKGWEIADWKQRVRKLIER